MDTRTLLRLEGGAAFAAATVAYLSLGESPWLYLLVFFLPDLGMLAYLAGPRLGSYGYNAVHTYLAPGALAAAGVWTGTGLAVSLALVWAAHVGGDRLLGYGLKRPSGFSDTHLSVQPAVLPFTEE